MLKEYDAGQVSIIFGTKRLTGLAEGTFITVARDEDSFTKQTGADGETTRSRTNNRNGSVELVLQQGSSANDFLSESYIADENGGGGVKPIKIVDKTGTTVAFAQSSWVKKPADASYGRDAGERTWTIDCAKLDLFVGGN